MVHSQFVVVDMQRSQFNTPNRAGEHFIRLTLGDASGTIKGIIWDSSIVPQDLKTDAVVLVAGEVTEYYGLQVVVSCLQVLDKSKVNRSYLQPSSSYDPEEMWRKLQLKIEQLIQNPKLLELWQHISSQQELIEKFKLAPAARSVHHYYLSGLLEHTLEVVYFCESICRLYPKHIDPSLLILGAALHDLGKVEEYDLDSYSFQLTDKGKLIGHIILGKTIVDKMVEEMKDFPANLKLALDHMLLSHHGQKEWGSPEVPKTAEAFALFHADLLSARLRQFTQIMESESKRNSSWSSWDRFLERSIYLGTKDIIANVKEK
ncbi:MAG: HD domain-containing protein [Firmicutes bacterium]|nr:HD domain-containing protein [Bacillota bacterium]